MLQLFEPKTGAFPGSEYESSAFCREPRVLTSRETFQRGSF